MSTSIWRDAARASAQHRACLPRSNYDARLRVAEVIGDGATPHLVRRRERIDDLHPGESALP